ncbi:hypothetical protein [Hyphomicrobium sp. CS1BSMeth3]|uniref:hypothetical protein n=1 Tax=Hyphomicrobium sp. CS1BSMeth3 TaxID=1892844 RepID=UPI000930096E|nr:hypothetical protein [Hyphomicrobium sp. CS1BSMeth3]
MSRTTPPTELSDAEISRLKRIGQRRGRRNPAKVPARLARTSAFAPKRRGLITDTNYDRLYVVPGHSIVRVAGRELGSQHRDALYAVFRLEHETVVLPDPNSAVHRSRYLRVTTTWRELLTSMGLTPHVNNVTALHYTFEDIKKVVVTVYEGDHMKLLEQHKQGKLPRSPGRMGNMLHDVEWEGLQLDSRVVLHYGEWSANMVFSAKLVSLNADVHFALASDYAKSYWPYIDSMRNHTWVDEERLAQLAGRDLWGPHESASTRRDFRSKSRKAFDDMVRAGGLKSWRVEVRGVGRHKSHRYHYEHALNSQMALPLQPPPDDAASHPASRRANAA